MKFTVREIAEIINGKVIGDEHISITSLSKIESGKKGSLSFLANSKYNHFLTSTQASAVIIGLDYTFTDTTSTTLIQVKDPYQSFALILNEFSKDQHSEVGIHNSSVVEEGVTIGKDTYIGPNVQIGKDSTIGNGVKIYANCSLSNNIKIGDNTIIYSGVNINSFCEIGSNCIIQSGVIIGCDGFGFAQNNDNAYTKVAQIGNVIIEDNVEIGANTTIDRATLGSTIIHSGVKLDNLIQVAHNVEIGKNTVIAAQSGIAGSTKIGENCMIGGQVGIVGHLEIGNNVKIAAQSGISSNIKDNEIVQGSPAFSISDYKRSYVYFKKLPQLNALLTKIEKELNKLVN
ncbi:UDP-3-O-(3-hydroxymyristoyl)glucosamine N-acyltransferase [Flavobacteriales bacterium]|nr:UDP-3-O-(3-hydroxymyristoyl)glucosamine N-acyltransferase [Flavobacteriales bacterium]MDB2674943.1 UDP-3-O-(3-hydroxymyristoyl)glucosamine N-acyltransferase [Flavobacteriales bacterium]